MDNKLKIHKECPNCKNNNYRTFVSNPYVSFCSVCGYYVSQSIESDETESIPHPYGVLKFSNSKDDTGGIKTLATEKDFERIINGLEIFKYYEFVTISRYVDNKIIVSDLIDYIRSEKLRKIIEKK